MSDDVKRLAERIMQEMAKGFVLHLDGIVSAMGLRNFIESLLREAIQEATSHLSEPIVRQLEQAHKRGADEAYIHAAEVAAKYKTHIPNGNIVGKEIAVAIEKLRNEK